MTIAIKGIWITWENQRRNVGISAALGWPLYVLERNGNKLARYIESSYKTLSIIVKEKPDLITAQNPSLLLALLVVLFKYIFNYKCIIDAHNAGLYPLEGRYRTLNILSRTIQTLADLTIVTNDSLAEIVNGNNGRAIVIPDRIPEPPANIKSMQLKGRVNLAYICSFSSDEPFMEVIEAARHLVSDVYIYITGNPNGKVSKSQLPANVILLGYIPDDEYWSLISSVDGVIVLTKRENCLVCGAYEAISVNKPMVLSKTKAIMDYFTSGCVYAEPKSSDICHSIDKLLENKTSLQSEVVELKNVLEAKWNANIGKLLKTVE